MNNSIQVFDYNGSAVRTVEKDGEIWFVAKDVCEVLDIQNATQAVQNLDDDERAMYCIGRSPIHGGGGEANIINEPGLYKLIFKSRKAEAKEFTRWVTHEVLPSIRQTGSYSMTKRDKHDYELRAKELEDHKRDQDLLGAQILQSMIDKQLFPLTPETRTVFAHEVFKLVTGRNYLGMLPVSTEKWYSATEIGEVLNISANKVGRIAKANGIKAPEGEANEYGRWIFSKAQYSSREVSSFIYSEAGLDWFIQYNKSLEDKLGA